MSVRPSVCLVDRQRQRRPAGLLLRSGAGSIYRSTAAAAARRGPRKFWSECTEVQRTDLFVERSITNVTEMEPRNDSDVGVCKRVITMTTTIDDDDKLTVAAAGGGCWRRGGTEAHRSAGVTGRTRRGAVGGGHDLHLRRQPGVVRASRPAHLLPSLHQGVPLHVLLLAWHHCSAGFNGSTTVSPRSEVTVEH